MWRHASKPRPNWLELVRGDGMVYAQIPDRTGTLHDYWHESHYYEFSLPEVAALEAVSEELHQMVVQACQKIVASKKLIAACDLPVAAQPMLQASLSRHLEEEEPTVYGRFDLAFNQDGQVKLLEYNADTPAALLEAAVTQWRWVEQVMPGVDQANTIHERLVKAWRDYRPWLGGSDAVWFVSGSNEPQEDIVTVSYLRDTAVEAGLETIGMFIEDVGWDSRQQMFVDLQGRPITACFSMWPWDWMLGEEFGQHLLAGHEKTVWVEPAWKAMAQSKVIVAVLWEMFPGHPALVPAYLDGPRGMTRFAAKPVAGWEGAGVMVVDGEMVAQEPVRHTKNQSLVWQELIDIARFDGMLPVIGSWIIDGACAGFGIRESSHVITNEEAQFTPHVIDAPASTPQEVAQFLATDAPLPSASVEPSDQQ